MRLRFSLRTLLIGFAIAAGLFTLLRPRFHEKTTVYVKKYTIPNHDHILIYGISHSSCYRSPLSSSGILWNTWYAEYYDWCTNEPSGKVNEIKFEQSGVSNKTPSGDDIRTIHYLQIDEPNEMGLPSKVKNSSLAENVQSRFAETLKIIRRNYGKELQEFLDEPWPDRRSTDWSQLVIGRKIVFPLDEAPPAPLSLDELDSPKVQINPKFYVPSARPTSRK